MSAALERVIVALERNIVRVQVALAYEVEGEVKVLTPVDTGWARANWHVTDSVADSLRIAVRVKGSEATFSQRAEDGFLRNASGRFADTGRGASRPRPVFVANGVPYIGKLNDGHSKQQPEGFVQRGMKKAVLTVARRGVI